MPTLCPRSATGTHSSGQVCEKVLISPPSIPRPWKGPSGSLRAGRDLPAAITSGLLLGGVVLLSLLFWKTAFMLIVAIAMVVAIWEMHRGLAAKGIDLPEQPLMLGGAIMVVVAYFWGAPALVTATAVSALVIMLWLLRRGVDGYVKNATASVFTLIYLPFLASFVALLLSEGGNLPAFGLNTDALGMRGVGGGVGARSPAPPATLTPRGAVTGGRARRRAAAGSP